jgi:hypothetical protein
MDGREFEIGSVVELMLCGSVSGIDMSGGGDEASRMVSPSASDSSTTCVVSVVLCVDGTRDPVNNNASSSVAGYFNLLEMVVRTMSIPNSKK